MEGWQGDWEGVREAGREGVSWGWVRAMRPAVGACLRSGPEAVENLDHDSDRDSDPKGSGFKPKSVS